MMSLEDQSPGVVLKLSDFLDSVVPSIVVFNAAGRVVFANIGALQLMNAPRADVIGRPISGVFKSCLDRAHQRAPSGQYVLIEQFVAGRWHMVQHYEIKDVRDPSVGQLMLISLTDISDRRSRDIALLQNIAGLEEATRITCIGMFRIENTANKVLWSPHMYTLHSVTPDRWRPGIENYPSFVIAEDRPLVRKEMEAMGEPGVGGAFEYRIMRPSGEIGLVQLDRRMLFDPNESPYRTFGTI